MIFPLFISCPKGLEYLLEDELKALGLQITRVSPHGVYGEGSLTMVYQLCLWSRLANRVQLILFQGHASDQHMLYQLCHDFPWQTVFSADKTIAIAFHGTSLAIRNTMFGAQVVKDGLVDHYREQHGLRPVIDRENPQIRLHAYLKNDMLTVSFDLTGYSMHQRGYRAQAGVAPIKENIAAAMLMRMKWPKLAEEGFVMHDPFCGAGTLVIEAVMMASKMAPGLLRQDQSLQYWAHHDALLWESQRAQALQQIKPMGPICSGADSCEESIAMARENAELAGVASLVSWNVCSFSEGRPLGKKGLLICNPPYGERLGDESSLMPLYQSLGGTLHAHYQGWQAAILTSNPGLARAMGLRIDKQYSLYNGALECKLYCIHLNETNQLKQVEAGVLSAEAKEFENRFRKNVAHLQKWAKRNQINCYRMYDADLPSYAYAIDCYDHDVVLQEYAAPVEIPAHKVERRRQEVLQIVPNVLGIDPQHVIVKQRKRQKGLNQYEKMNQVQRTMVVHEGSARLLVNLHDYLDTGLFLDHRLLRLRFGKLPPGTRFLNCFSYTASASVHAALAGAFTTNVDLSNTYLRWGEENFRINDLDTSRHQFIQYDCLSWLKVTRDRFDVIFLDPPSFSNSKSMTETLDIQRDHVLLIHAAMSLLNPGGTLYFSTNLRHFKLSLELKTSYVVRDISGETIDLDFKRNHRIHQCYVVRALSF